MRFLVQFRWTQQIAPPLRVHRKLNAHIFHIQRNTTQFWALQRLQLLVFDLRPPKVSAGHSP
jgi:hypothetical protein